MLEKWRGEVEEGFVRASVYEDLWSDIERVCREVADEFAGETAEIARAVRLICNELQRRGMRVHGSIPEDVRSWLVERVLEYVSAVVLGHADEGVALRKARVAARSASTALLRDLYETWVFLSLIKTLAPRSSFISPIWLTRRGLQRASRSIPPNCTMMLGDGRWVSLFLEAPRYIGWSTPEEVEVAAMTRRLPRPDIMVYVRDEKVDDILEPKSELGIVPPDAILEVKCFEGWWKKPRSRDQIRRYRELCNNVVIVSRVHAPEEFEGIPVVSSVGLDETKLTHAFRLALSGLLEV